LETKDDLLAEISDLLGLQSFQTTVGSSIPRRFFSELLDYFGLPDDGDAVTAFKNLILEAGIQLDSSFTSEGSPSGGGGTVTLKGLKALRNAISLLLDEDEARSGSTFSDGVDKPERDSWTLLRGQTILRKVLHDTYGGIRQGGISPSNSTNNVFIFTDDTANREHGYETDFWLDDNTFIYCGDGQTGHQVLNRRNGTILNHIAQSRRLRLFSPVAGLVTYLGEMKIDHDKPYELRDGVGRDGNLRTVVMFRLKRVVEVNQLSHEDGPTKVTSFGSQYKYANESVRNIEEISPFATDPNLLDRALQLHSITQNTVANWVIGHGLFPLSPTGDSCDFDIAWDSPNGRVVCEVKSLSDKNEKHQFRLGLGQVLEYSHQLSATPILIFSKRPTNRLLIETAIKSGIGVLWPEILQNYDPSDMRNVRFSVD
jgi:hypothetical protein